MLDRHRHGNESVFAEQPADISRRVEFADSSLNRNLPGRRGTDEDVRTPISDVQASIVREPVGLEGAPEKALGHARKPATLGNITTAVGLLSLRSGEVEPIRKFGIFSAAGVMGTLIHLFTYVPAALQTWPLQLPKEHRCESNCMERFLMMCEIVERKLSSDLNRRPSFAEGLEAKK